MGYTYSFIDNQTYGTDDVNAAFGRLVSSGVGFYSGNTNLVAGMNETQADYATTGVNIGGCKVEIIEPGTAKINPGWAFFGDGSSLVIDEEGVTFRYTVGAKCYIYLKRDVSQNTATPMMELTAGGSGTIPLAEIAVSGELTDTRKFAVTKIFPNSANFFYTYQSPDFSLSSYMNEGELLDTIDVGGNWAKYIMISKESGKDMVGCFLPLEDGVRTEFVKPHQNSSGSARLAFLKRGQYIDIFGYLAGSGVLTRNYELIVC